MNKGHILNFGQHIKKSVGYLRKYGNNQAPECSEYGDIRKKSSVLIGYLLDTVPGLR
jgi:hypothetical protein